jgi:hypothetical protein
MIPKDDDATVLCGFGHHFPIVFYLIGSHEMAKQSRRNTAKQN